MDLLALVDAEAGTGAGSFRQAAEFCARTHDVPFGATKGARIEVGTKVHLVVGDPPSVVSDNSLIGFVGDSIAAAMAACLALGYVLSGTVESYEPEVGRGSLLLRGVRRQVA